MVYPILQRELTIHLNNGHWYLRPTEDPNVLGPVDFGWKRYKLSMFHVWRRVGRQQIPGSRRLVFCVESQGRAFISDGGAADAHGVGERCAGGFRPVCCS
jgi:hypothetical protein